ncbi:MAG: acyltransferase family protein [Myxococcota bacterium]
MKSTAGHKTSEKKSARGYRPEIDGLRAVAVIAVLLFHIQYKIFSGGFLGVDIFFVLSGFLITGIIHDEIEVGQFSLARFYERRIRRILPALYLTMSVTFVFGMLTFLPWQLISLGKSIISVSIFSSNIWLWRQSGYFAAASEMMPLLHTWSLSVEEQFYIIFPIFIWASITMLGKKITISIVAIIAFLSVVLFLIGNQVAPGATFYLLPTRAWELMSGALLALTGFCFQEYKTKNILTFIGVILILAGFILSTANGNITPYLTIGAICGTLLILSCGEENVVGNILSTGPFRFFGKISYSLYLFHWPALVLAKQLAVGAKLSAIVSVSLMGACTLLAWASWRYVEQPARRIQMRRASLFGTAGVTIIAGLLVGYIPLLGKGFPARFTDASNRYAEAVMSPRGRACLEQSSRTQAICNIGDGQPSFVLWGDSHAGALLPAFEALSSSYKRSGILAAFNGCSPFVSGPSSLAGLDAEHCKERNKDIISKVASDQRIDTVFITSFWSAYQFDQGAVSDVVRQLGGKKIVILEDVPTADVNIPWLLALSGPNGKTLAPTEDRFSLSEGNSQGRLRIVRLSDAFCSNGKCPIEIDGHSLYADSNHVSEYAAKTIIGPYIEKFAETIWETSASH